MDVLSDGRTRRTTAEWRAIFERFEASGLSALAFCRQERVSRSAFARWRLQSRGTPAPTGRFIELHAGSLDETRSVTPGGFELVLPGGAVLRQRPQRDVGEQRAEADLRLHAPDRHVEVLPEPARPGAAGVPRRGPVRGQPGSSSTTAAVAA